MRLSRGHAAFFFALCAARCAAARKNRRSEASAALAAEAASDERAWRRYGVGNHSSSDIGTGAAFVASPHIQDWDGDDWAKYFRSFEKRVGHQVNELVPDFIKTTSLGLLFTPLVWSFAVMLLVISSALDVTRRKEAKPEAELPLWSLGGIAALTSYRFYTGFLGATWMPYLLAMEGAAMTEDRQSFFMGCAKLIYGMTVMLNPMFGLLGDRIAVVSRWSGRRLFVLGGVGLCGFGIYGCLVAAEIKSMPWYMVATVLWMLGEAMVDVTTETLVPELLPRSQYQVSSSIRSLHFLAGGLIGYIALVIFKDEPYTWIYYSYLAVMWVCALFTLSAIQMGDLGAAAQKSSRRAHVDTNTPFSDLVLRAYVVPATFQGGFPRACLAIFFFSLGSAPMFFLLLMVRDVVGVRGRSDVQTHFGFISMLFFVMAAVASVFGVASQPKPAHEAESPLETGGAGSSDAHALGGGSGEEETEGSLSHTQHASGGAARWRWMALSTVSFGVIVAVIPSVGLLPALQQRIVAFYFVGGALGFSFGAVYTRFQECTWSLIPRSAEIANAMGFCAMCKMLGVGFGNFLVGVILDRWAHIASSGPATGHGFERYELSGYFFMCTFCHVVVLIAAGLAHTIPGLVLRSRKGVQVA